jgi:hypothetical protein
MERLESLDGDEGNVFRHLSTPERQKERSSSSATAINISCLDLIPRCESGNTPRTQTPKTRQETQSLFDQQCVH